MIHKVMEARVHLNILAEVMSIGDWIGLATLLFTIFCAFVGWLSATYMRIGKVLAEIRRLKNQVDVLSDAFDSQARIINAHAIKLTTVEIKLDSHLEDLT